MDNVIPLVLPINFVGCKGQHSSGIGLNLMSITFVYCSFLSPSCTKLQDAKTFRSSSPTQGSVTLEQGSVVSKNDQTQPVFGKHFIGLRPNGSILRGDAMISHGLTSKGFQEGSLRYVLILENSRPNSVIGRNRLWHKLLFLLEQCCLRCMWWLQGRQLDVALLQSLFRTRKAVLVIGWHETTGFLPILRRTSSTAPVTQARSSPSSKIALNAPRTAAALTHTDPAVTADNVPNGHK